MEHAIADLPRFATLQEPVTVGEPRAWTRGTVQELPELSALLMAATVIPVTADGTDYEVLLWGEGEERRGWLCLPPSADASALAVAPVQQSFWTLLGGIVETAGQGESRLDNQDAVLTVEAALEPFGEALEAYAWIWEEAGQEVPIQTEDYYVAAIESNYDLTLARRTDGSLLLFAPDSGFDDITPFAGSPEQSLYTFDDLPDLTSWIEDWAAAWRAA
ncbi:hypothetical protein [Kineosporia babensis]|uniref:Uncharacterized protein n=1 Tax=Kineosporia babensis TaxID=499548 RepID=A0A9X1NN53_9ACTN|nr:hypothetical protein [Kineosporia babensis]MCD5316579.1 hypothetical protein [Kineosporia babensis]